MVLAKNKKAYFDYEILDKIEAGLVLSGQEVKSAKNGQVNLKGSYVNFEKDEAFLVKMHISKYKQAGNLPDYDPEQSRKLLLRKQQLINIKSKSLEKGLTIVPLIVYTKGRLIKVEIGVAKGKKNYDKRDKIKKRDQDRELKRFIKTLQH